MVGAGGAGKIRGLLAGAKGDDTSFSRWVQGERNLPRVLHRQDGDYGVSGSLEAPPSSAGPAKRSSMVRCRWSGKAPGLASG